MRDVTIQPVDGIGFSAMKQIKKVLSEKNILSAIAQLQNSAPSSGFVQSSEIKTHPLCARMPNPSFFRALKKLVSDGSLSLPANRKKGLYRLEV